MSKVLWKSLLISPAVLGATLVVSLSAIAAGAPAVKEVSQSPTAEANLQEAPKASEVSVAVKPTEATLPQSEQASEALKGVPSVATPVAQALPEANATEAAPVDTTNLQQILRYSNEGKDSVGQITNASQFRDVQPSDWAYEALDRIVQKYGCLVGYPDGTYRGNRALSRYEFAAGLNACLRQVEALIASQPDSVSRRDFEALQRLVEEFRTELATLGTRVDNLEGRTQFLEDHQFSTTTKLGGEVIFAATDTFDRYDNNTIFGDRVRLDLRTSFTGRDTLHTRLAAGNLAPFFTTGGTVSTAEGTQTFNITGGDYSNGVKVDWLAYYFPFRASQVYVAATGGIHSDYAPTLNPYFEDFDGGNGALSTFAQESPIYRIGGGAGAGINLAIGKGGGILRPTSLTLGYLAGDANNPGEDTGLFNGSYGALAQLNFSVSDRFALAATYVHGYHNAGTGIFNIGTAGSAITGTGLANNPQEIGGVAGLLDSRPLSTNSYGIQAALRPSDRFSISGFVAKTDVRILGRGDADVWTYGAGVAFPNLGRPGNVLGFFAGVEPTLKGIDIPNQVDFSRRNAYHFEGFYKYKLSDNISITPGVIWLTNPGQQDRDDAVIGTVRTTFTF